MNRSDSRAALLVALLLAALAGPAPAQTRLSLTGGALVPFGDLDDTSDTSVRIGLRAEWQPTNALGQRRLLAFHVGGAWSGLDLDPAYEAALVAAGRDSDGYLVTLQAGARAYSSSAPFFVTGSAGWTRLRPGGDRDGLDGLDLGAGLGFLVPWSAAVLEAEASVHQVVAEDDTSFQYLALGLGLGLPF